MKNSIPFRYRCSGGPSRESGVALIMALISVPFGFLVGNRGAMTGVGVGIAVAMAYLATGLLFDQFGNVNLLPPMVAAWAPDALFSAAGLYLMLRMRS